MKKHFKTLATAMLCLTMTLLVSCKKDNNNGTGGGDTPIPPTPTTHEFVDLGLPSGVLWATCNVGADSPEEYGLYFALGEITTKNCFDWHSYKWCNGSSTSITKYNSDSHYGVVDNKFMLDQEDDAASVRWGDGWRMPTSNEFEELIGKCDYEWTTQNGVNGIRFTGLNGNSIFMPAAGYLDDDSLYGNHTDGYYWACSPIIANVSSCLQFSSNDMCVTDNYRRCGQVVRPVYSTLPNVTTSDVTNIDGFKATCGGVVASNGATATERGVCWSTSKNPTIKDNHSTDGSGAGSFTSSITGLEANTKYYVRAYAKNNYGVAYGEQVAFLALPNNNVDDRYVDLGLPSGLLWATCNIGADYPADYGDYFAWGETSAKSTYTWNTYIWCNGSYYDELTKYNTDPSYGIVDNKTTLDQDDDAAHVNWGGDWRMPTVGEFSELLSNCECEYTKHNGVGGLMVTGPNGKGIFLPAAGRRDYGSLYNAGSIGYYWSSSLNGYPDRAYELYFNSGKVSMSYGSNRYYGQSVRPVSAPQN